MVVWTRGEGLAPAHVVWSGSGAMQEKCFFGTLARRTRASERTGTYPQRSLKSASPVWLRHPRREMLLLLAPELG
jgi:hypothetical protein